MTVGLPNLAYSMPPLSQNSKITRPNLKIFVHFAYGRGSVLRRHYDTLYTSGFVDDVMFSYHGTNRPESSTMLCLEVRQLAVTTTVFGRVHENAARVGGGRQWRHQL